VLQAIMTIGMTMDMEPRMRSVKGGATCMAAAQLEHFHSDPADRLVVATVQEVGATLMTADEKILGWSGRLDRRNARI
jgi:PIN domain nuclease of toxin-antitoxin system